MNISVSKMMWIMKYCDDTYFSILLFFYSRQALGSIGRVSTYERLGGFVLSMVPISIGLGSVTC